MICPIYLTTVEIQVDIFEIDPLHKIWRKIDIWNYALLRNLCLYIPVSTDNINLISIQKMAGDLKKI